MIFKEKKIIIEEKQFSKKKIIFDKIKNLVCFQKFDKKIILKKWFVLFH